jgi:hypothetical protein
MSHLRRDQFDVHIMEEIGVDNPQGEVELSVVRDERVVCCVYRTPTYVRVGRGRGRRVKEHCVFGISSHNREHKSHALTADCVTDTAWTGGKRDFEDAFYDFSDSSVNDLDNSLRKFGNAFGDIAAGLFFCGETEISMSLTELAGGFYDGIEEVELGSKITCHGCVGGVFGH